jgi:UDP-N-acetylglucosamine acyltransferase
MPAEIRGINQVGLERRGFEAENIRALREAYKLIYRANLNTKQAVAAIREQIAQHPEIEALIAFIETSKRGIVH